MKIGIDARTFIKDAWGGGATYTHELLRELLSLESKDHYLLLTGFRQKIDKMTFPISRSVKICPLRIPGRLVDRLWEKFNFPFVEFFTGQVDIFHSTNLLKVPQKRGSSVVTIYDVVWRRHPEFITNQDSPFFRYIERSVKEADIVVTISQNSRMELIELLKVNESKIRVTPLAASSSFKPAIYPEILAKYGINRPYILSVGTIQPRKNFATLIQAYNILRQSHEFDGLLVITGAWGWKYDEVYHEWRSSPFSSDIHILTNVKTAHLPVFYSMAEFFILISFHEGFGLPLVEAMACGSPIITSNRSCMPEIVGEAGMLVAPDSKEAVAESMKQLLGNRELRHYFSKLSLKQAKTYSWADTARQTLDIYRECM